MRVWCATRVRLASLRRDESGPPCVSRQGSSPSRRNSKRRFVRARAAAACSTRLAARAVALLAPLRHVARLALGQHDGRRLGRRDGGAARGARGMGPVHALQVHVLGALTRRARAQVQGDGPAAPAPQGCWSRRVVVASVVVVGVVARRGGLVSSPRRTQRRTEDGRRCRHRGKTLPGGRGGGGGGSRGGGSYPEEAEESEEEVVVVPRGAQRHGRAAAAYSTERGCSVAPSRQRNRDESVATVATRRPLARRHLTLPPPPHRAFTAAATAAAFSTTTRSTAATGSRSTSRRRTARSLRSSRATTPSRTATRSIRRVVAPPRSGSEWFVSARGLVCVARAGPSERDLRAAPALRGRPVRTRGS